MSTRKTFTCVQCAASLAKNETQFVSEDSFAFLSRPPKHLAIGSYCYQCFDRDVAPELDRYNAKMESAKNVNVFFASQSKESRFVRRIEKPIKVENCQDRDEVVMRLAFLAVEANKNSIVDVDLTSIKVRNGSWQSSLWSGRAIPADIDEAHLNRRYASAPN